MNIPKNRFVLSCIFCALILFVLQACTALQTFPKTARAGDTISLAVGSAEGMTKDTLNTTAVYVPDAGGSYPLTIRSVFNLYPDKKSRLYLTSVTTPIIDTASHEAWQTVMVIDLPTDLPVGTGSVQITSSALYPEISSHINDVPIALEIIGTGGSSHPFTYEFGIGSSETGDLSQLEPLPHALITPPTNDAAYYGAMEMRLTLPTSKVNPLTEANIRVILDDMTPSTVSNRNFIWSIDDGELVVIIISPAGLLRAIESRFSIVLIPRFSFTGTPAITSVSFFDVDGNSAAGPTIPDFDVALK